MESLMEPVTGITWGYVLMLTSVVLLIFAIWLQYLSEQNCDLHEALTHSCVKLEKALKKQTGVWCELHGHNICRGYAAKVIVAHDGFLVVPIEPKERILVLISELHAYDVLVQLGAPPWKFVASNDPKVYGHVIMLGAVYMMPKNKK